MGRYLGGHDEWLCLRQPDYIRDAYRTAMRELSGGRLADPPVHRLTGKDTVSSSLNANVFECVYLDMTRSPNLHA